MALNTNTTKTNIIKPDNIKEIYGNIFIPDNEEIYVKVGKTNSTYEGDKWRHDKEGSLLKIAVRDMRAYNDTFIVAGEILNDASLNGTVKSFEYTRDIFMIQPPDE
tara:strand:+ start:639 stop:956 length:318 start_codon:yes stop_codon:yes gene_type:complete